MKKNHMPYQLTQLRPGYTAMFNYPKEFTSLEDYSTHRGKQVTVIRPCSADEADPLYDDPDGVGASVLIDRMYVVQAEDGWIGHAWHSELIEP